MPRASALTSTRRRFLHDGALALGGLSAAAALPADLLGQAPGTEGLLPHLADVSGNGQVGAGDIGVAQNALFGRRGFGLRPAQDFDMRADVFGKGQIDQASLEAVRDALERLSGSPESLTRRPITVAWHYGWYNQRGRPIELQTVRFKGGDYASWDPEVEALFNDQKNEFGITVDALSWIPEDKNAGILRNYRNGLFQTDNLQTRHLALLYENTIALPVSGGRIDFFDPAVPRLLERHFAQMAQFLLEARDLHGARIFNLDGRPVMFIFGSHIWGLTPVSRGQFGAVEASFGIAREAFRQTYGQYPYVVGEEMQLSATAEYSPDRQRRTPLFDATHVYHHASNLKGTDIAADAVDDIVMELTQSYLDNQVGILDAAYEAVEPIRNRYTGQRVLVIPNLAPGFAKPGLPTLKMGRREYADFMKLLESVHVERHIKGPWADALGTAALPAPVYIVGSWNEEFEGHAVLPAEFNFSLPEVTQGGFDLSMAIKEVFGWNHYAQRAIAP